jgi:hypothetical protein
MQGDCIDARPLMRFDGLAKECRAICAICATLSPSQHLVPEPSPSSELELTRYESHDQLICARENIS